MTKVNDPTYLEIMWTTPIKDNATKLHEDNVVCITLIKGGFIKGDRTKHIFPKFFYTHKLQENGEIDIQ